MDEVGRFTETEALTMGKTVEKLRRLRYTLKHFMDGGSLIVRQGPATSETFGLPSPDVRAILSLLIERESALLIQMNVDLDKP